MGDDTRQWPIDPHPERDVVLDARSLRAVAHPVRLRILGLLRLEGPSTATALAVRLGLNSGATSYHLRQLAGSGLIVEDEDRGSGRDRWWRAAHRSSFFRAERLSEDDYEVGVAYQRSLALVYAERMQQAAEEAPTLPPDWQGTTSFGDYPFLLTAAEAKRLLEELRAVVSRYRPLHGPAETSTVGVPRGAEPFHLQLQAFLIPGHEVTGEVPGDD